MVSNASDDLPDPERPVMTTSWSRGISISTFFRVCSRAPRTWIVWGINAIWGFGYKISSKFVHLLFYRRLRIFRLMGLCLSRTIKSVMYLIGDIEMKALAKNFVVIAFVTGSIAVLAYYSQALLHLPPIS